MYFLSFKRFIVFLLSAVPVFIFTFQPGVMSAQVVLGRWTFEDMNITVDENNSENTAKTISRESTPGIVYSWDPGNPGYSYSSDSWNGGSGSKYYMIELNTSYTSAIKVSFDQYSSNNGPRDFRMQYKIGTGGTWLPLTGNDIVLPANAWTSNTFGLPPDCDNQLSVFVRWVMTSNSSASGGAISPSGISRIDNILAAGLQNYSCFTYGYIEYYTCGAVYSFPSAAGGGLGSTPEGMPGAPNYGTCWKNINAGDRANWIVIRPTASGLWSFNFSPSTGNVNAWIWGPYDELPTTCSDLQELRDCANGTGGNPITVSTNVIEGKHYVTLVTNPTGTNSIITLTVSSGEATLTPPIAWNAERCGPGTLTLTASGCDQFERYEWWDAPVGGNRLKRSATHLDSTYTTPSLTTTTTYYVSKLFLQAPPYNDSCNSPRVPVVATVNPVAVAPVSISTNLTNVCSPDTRDVTLTAAGGSGTTLNWYKDACCSALLATGNPYTIPAPTVTTTYFAAWETVCGISACASVTITVNAPVTTGVISADQTICASEDPVPIISDVNGTGSGVISYRWESFTGPGPWTVMPGVTGSSFDPPPGLPQTVSYRRTTISTEAGGTCESQPTPPVTVFVNNLTAGDVGTSQVLCAGDDPKPFFEISPASATGLLTYQWEQAPFSTGPWSAIAAAVNSLYTAPAGLPATTFYRRTVISVLNTKICTANSSVVSIIVNPLPATSVIFHR